MDDPSIDPAARLVDEFVGGTVDVTLFDVRLVEIAARDPQAITRLEQILEQRHGDGSLPDAAFSALKARVDVHGATRFTQSKRGSTGTRLRTPHHTGMRTKTEVISGPPPISVDATLKPGVVVKGRFLLEKKIGEGGMGLVFKARDLRNERFHEFVAIKFLSDRLLDVPDALESLQFEVRKAHELAHPNIVTVYEFDQDGPLSYIYMELLEGQGLDGLLKKNDARGVPFAEAWPIVRGAGTALAYAHEKGIVHSDFKPGNVFITNDERVKILDFGIARAVRLDPNEFDTSVLGGLTPAYASPEMGQGKVEPDPRDDIYGLACVSYELLAGKHPFGRKPAHKAKEEKLVPPTIPGLPKRRMRALARGLAFERAARTPSVHEFLEDLEQKPKARHWLRTGVAALGVAAAVTVGFTWYTSAQQCATVDREFLDELRAAAKPRLPSVDPSYRDVLLEQGGEYLAEAAESFDPTLLSVGVSSALGSFTGVYSFDRQDAAADAGVLRVLEAYRTRADSLLEAGDARGAITAADYGLAVHPRHCALSSLKRRAQALLD
jgi:serine/threonine protein kinase